MNAATATKEQQIMAFLHERVFDPVMASPKASDHLKQGIRYTIMRLEQRDAAGMVHYFWSAIIGTDRSVSFSTKMRREGFARFEESIDDFRAQFS